MTLALVTIAIPFDSEFRDDVDVVLSEMGNPPTDEIARRLDATRAIHFVSIHAVACAPAPRDRLLIEATADSGINDAVEKIAEALGPELRRVLDAAHIDTGGMSIAHALSIHVLDVGPGWRQTLGLAFDGSPTLTVPRIKAEHRLATRILDEKSDVLSRPGRARDKLEEIRDWLWCEGEKWAFEAARTPFLRGGRERTPSVRVQIAFAALLRMLWLALLVLLIALWAAVGIANALVYFVALVCITAAVLISWLRRKELSDLPDQTPPDPAVMAEIERGENWCTQNLFVTCSTLKPEWRLRMLTLRLALNLVERRVSMSYRPGHMRSIQLIHSARWMLLPGTDKLLFCANFSEGWESFLEELILKAPDGLTGIWSNAAGFPRTAFLFLQGAADGPRFRRWARNQQIVSRFWYTAYPDLHASRIRLNAAIREGIATARTDKEADDWLALFGAAPRPDTQLDTPEVPTLVLGALRHLHHAACVALRLSDDPVQACAWLRGIAPDITFGEHPRDGGQALAIGFSADGLRRFGLDDDTLRTFPITFQHGMQSRAAMLGDHDDSAPSHWQWGNDGAAHVLLLLYADDTAALQQRLADETERAAGHGHTATFQRVLSVLPPRNEPMRDPIGFAFGMSQPIIRGTPRGEHRRRGPGDDIHLVEPGEFVLGYPDNGGTVAPGPSVAAGFDKTGLLRMSLDLGRRDLGRNGTFIVVRELEQDVDGFHDAIASAALRLHAAQPGFSGWDRLAVQDFIGGKMMGRWKSGASLVAHPRADPGLAREPDNDFTFAGSDPAGTRVPFGAHIRRANPRDSIETADVDALVLTRRHRILRVGRAYPPQPGSGRPGLLFTCLNADIERQFEFVQQTWLNGRNFHGLPDEADPIVAKGSGCFTIPTADGPLRLTGLPDFVTVRGGGYFFMPSKTTIRFLASER
jgi:deferrochelatase/peroxidase EfeB